MNGPLDQVTGTPRTDGTADVPWPTSGHRVPASEPGMPSFGDAAAPAVQAQAESVTASEDALVATRDAWTENLRTQVRRRPLAALATALAVGAVLARAMR